MLSIPQLVFGSKDVIILSISSVSVGVKNIECLHGSDIKYSSKCLLAFGIASANFLPTSLKYLQNPFDMVKELFVREVYTHTTASTFDDYARAVDNDQLLSFKD
jgi:hypothetical protein